MSQPAGESHAIASHPTCTALLAAVVLAHLPQTSRAVVVFGQMTAEVGNQGNLATVRTVPVGAAGTFDAGPLTGADGGNSTQGRLLVSLQPLPRLDVSATGYDNGQAADAAFTNVYAGISYPFTVTGPRPGFVPVRFAGTTAGTLTSLGEPTRLYGHVGTSIRITAEGIANTFGAVGTQIGTAPGYYASNAGMVNLGWGSRAPYVVDYTSYASTWEWGAELFTGQSGTVILTTDTTGGTTGSLRPGQVFTSSTASSTIDPFIFIDPQWLASNPGYAIVVDADVGNTPAVPEPATGWLFAGGLAGLAFVVRGARRGPQ